MARQEDIEIYKLKAELCKTFSDYKRLMILNELRGGEKTVGDLVKTLQIPQAVTSRHLAVLRNGGVVTARRDGTSIYYRLTDPKIAEACDIVHEVLLNQMANSKRMAEKLIT